MRLADIQRRIAAPLMPQYAEPEALAMARILLEEVTGQPWQALQQQPSLAALSPHNQAFVESCIGLLLEQYPIQHILSKAHFYGYDFHVSPAVLIPRRETEELVHWAVGRLAAVAGAQGRGVAFADLGTGSGCIAITLWLELQKRGIDCEAIATEVDNHAILTAMPNMGRLTDGGVRLHRHDMTGEAPFCAPASLDVLISNPPYIPPQEAASLPPNVALREPHLALFTPADDPLHFYRHIARHAHTALRPGGWVMVECHCDYAGQVAEMFQTLGLGEPELRHDLQGLPRMVAATRPRLSP